MNWNPSPALVTLREQINTLWPGRDRSSDGMIGDTSHAARPSDHNPDWSAGGIVRAIDVDEDGIDVWRVINALIADSRTAYVIYEGRIWENPAVWPGRGYWRAYAGPNPHDHHFHLSVRRGVQWDRDARPWALSPIETEEDEDMPSAEEIAAAVWRYKLAGSSAGEHLRLVSNRAKNAAERALLAARRTGASQSDIADLQAAVDALTEK